MFPKFSGKRHQNFYSHGGATYVDFNLVLSKIENKNKYLPLTNYWRTENGQEVQYKAASSLDLLNYQNLSVGFDFNILNFDIPNWKTKYVLDFGIRYGRTAVQDSVFNVGNSLRTFANETNNIGINTFMVYPKLKWILFPEERYGFSVSYQVNYFKARTDAFVQLNDYNDYACGDNPKN